MVLWGDRYRGKIWGFRSLGVSPKPPSGDEVRPPTPPPQGATCPHSSSASPRVPKQRDLGAGKFTLGAATSMLQPCATAGNTIHTPTIVSGGGVGDAAVPCWGFGGDPQDRIPKVYPSNDCSANQQHGSELKERG
jgi:hypothetical protein